MRIKILKIIFIMLVFSTSFFVYVTAIGKTENIAYKKQIVGTFNDANKITDGEISNLNFGESIEREDVEKFFIVVLGQAKYIDSLKIYWVKGYEPEEYQIEVGRSLFDWQYKFIHKLQNEENTDGLIVTKDNLKNAVGFFVKITILKKKVKTVRLSEIEIYKGKLESKLQISDVKIIKIEDNSIKLSFNTSIPTAGFVKVGEEKYSMKEAGRELDIFKEHIITIDGLLAGTEYYIQPFALDVNSKIAASEIFRVKTTGIPLPRIKKLYVKKTGSFDATIEWDSNVECKLDFYIGTTSDDMEKVMSDSDYKTDGKIEIEGLIPESYYLCKIILTDKYNKNVSEQIDFKTTIENIAYGKMAYGSFMYKEKSSNPEFGLLKKITDGIIDANGLVCSDILKNKDQMAIVDLGEEYKLRKISVIWRGIDYPKIFDIYIGKDMKNMKLLKDKILTKWDGKKTLSSGDVGLMLRKVDIDCYGKQARFIKALVKKGTEILSDLPYSPDAYLQLAEIEAFKIPDYGNAKYKARAVK